MGHQWCCLHLHAPAWQTADAIQGWRKVSPALEAGPAGAAPGAERWRPSCTGDIIIVALAQTPAELWHPLRTGDSITIAPAQTLTDKEYQRLRDASIAIIRDMGVECGGSNVQMAVNPDDGQVRTFHLGGGTTK